MIPWEDDFDMLSKKQKELVVGSLLGDGRLECRSTKGTARLRIHHADSQKDYLFWKFKQLKNITFTKPKRHEYIDKRYSTKVVSWYFHTKTLSSLGRYHKLFYRDQKKIIPKSLERMVTPFSLALWIMDDGCLYKQSLILNTQSFTFDENEYLKIFFLKKFSVKVGLQKDRRNFRLYFPRPATKRIQYIIEPFLFNSKFIPVETDPSSLTSMNLVR